MECLYVICGSLIGASLGYAYAVWNADTYDTDPRYLRILNRNKICKGIVFGASVGGALSLYIIG